MVIIAGTFDLAPEDRDAFLEFRKAAVLAARAEDGCLEFAQSADGIDAGRVHLFEVWESAEALAAHTARRLAATEPAGRPPVLKRRVMRYEISSAEPLER